MTRSYGQHLTPSQTEPDPLKSMIPNNAGGYGFAITPWQRLERFLILGALGGTYYVSPVNYVVGNFGNILQCLKEDGPRAVKMATEISLAGRALSNSHAIMLIALAATKGDPTTKAAAREALPQICRIPTHLFEFLEDYQRLDGGWGRGMRTAVGNWYLSNEKLAYHVAKYQQRNGWTHKDALRLAHPKPRTDEQASIFRWVVDRENPNERVIVRGAQTKQYASVLLPPQILQDFAALQAAGTKEDVIRILQSNSSLSWEMIPTEWLAHSDVWEVLLPNLPMTALLRNLGRLSSLGVIGDFRTDAIERLATPEYLHAARIHPISVLIALKTYGSGRGLKGNLTWHPIKRVKEVLEAAFYMAFSNVEPTGKNILIGIDISGSMTWEPKVAGLFSSEIAAAMAMVFLRTEKNAVAYGFSTTFLDLGLTANMSLEEVLRRTRAATAGGTDCSLPMHYATVCKLPVDAFVVITDNETWAGNVHPHTRLKVFRSTMQKPKASLSVLGTVATDISIADPSDPYMMDFVGFDANVPEAVSAFIR